jgi:predicted helicase
VRLQPLRVRGQRLKPLLLRMFAARLKACPDTKQVSRSAPFNWHAQAKRYAANLKRELPCIPFVTAGPSGPKPTRDDTAVFWEFVKAGRRLAEIHVEYEKQPEYPLERVENPAEQLNWRVQKMRLSKDKSTLTYNEWLTLKCIPRETYDYRLGNRSALEWVVDQYQVSTDKRSGIVNDPNREDDPEYIVRLIGQVITVSLETVKIVKALPALGIAEEVKAVGAGGDL